MGLLSNRESESRQARYLRLAMCVVKKIASYIGGFGGICSTSSDATCDHLAGLARPQSSLRRGYVVRSGLGSYDCEVVLGDGTTVTCSTLSPVANQLAGVSQACVPVAGSCVLVMVTSSGLAGQPAPRGIVLGVIPENDTGGVSVRGESLVTKLGDTDHPEAGVSQFTESGPAAIASDVGFLGKGEFQCGRLRGRAGNRSAVHGSARFRRRQCEVQRTGRSGKRHVRTLSAHQLRRRGGDIQRQRLHHGGELRLDVPV